MKATASTTPPAAKKPVFINTKDVALLTARLAQILAEEVDLLEAMKVRDIEKLQEEKLFLIEALETHRKILKQRPELSETIPSQDKHELRQVVEVFEDMLAQNHRKLQMAKEVNEHVVNAIRDVVIEKTQNPYYGNSGMKKMAQFESSSITLNKHI